MPRLNIAMCPFKAQIDVPLSESSSSFKLHVNKHRRLIQFTIICNEQMLILINIHGILFSNNEIGANIIIFK